MPADQPVRVAVSGARGRTGQVVIDALRNTSGVAVVAALVRTNATDGEFSDLSTLASQAHPDVLVDFTTFPASKTIALGALEHGIRVIVGATGYDSSDLEDLRAASARTKIGAIYAANFSIGAVLMLRFAAAAAPYFTHAEIVETHHTEKKDSPSGTALAAANLIARAARMQYAPSQTSRVTGARGAQVSGIGIHSLRLPGVVGEHEITFANEGETLTIRHNTSSRTAFVSGVVEAIRAVVKLDHLVVGLESLLQ